jgi:hypothetical protein
MDGPTFFSRAWSFRGRFSHFPCNLRPNFRLYIGNRNHTKTCQQRKKTMTDIKKTGKDKGKTKAKKLELRKETLSDLSLKRKAAAVKGGAAVHTRTGYGYC